MPEEPAGASEARARELSGLCTHLQDHVEREKADLARRLHDDLGGLLTAAKIDLSWLQSRLEDPAIRQRLAQLGAVLDDAMDLKRQVVEELRPSLLDHFGLPTALRAHVESVCARAGLGCEVHLADEMESIPREMAIGLFRVIQEGLDSIVRHAGAATVRIEIAGDATSYVLKLIDDGRRNRTDGSESAARALAGMRHRIEAMGGRFSIDSSGQRGSILHVSVPRSAPT